jgi:colicin import membrane protein
MLFGHIGYPGHRVKSGLEYKLKPHDNIPVTQENNYKLPLILAIVLHILLFGFLFFRFAVPALHLQGPAGQVNIVSATIVNQKLMRLADLKAEQKQQQQIEKMKKLQAQKQQKLAEEKIKQQQMAAQKALAIKQQQALQRKLAEQRAITAQKAQLQQEKIRIAKIKQQQAVALEQKKQQRISTQLKAAQQKMLQQQITQEQQQLAASAAASARNQQQQSEIDKYKALVVQAISQNWIVPDNIDKSLYCELLIRVGPGGVVLGVQVTKNSGNTDLDNSAVAAVTKTSPLPVPTDPELFDKFRELRLTVKPKNIVSE